MLPPYLGNWSLHLFSNNFHTLSWPIQIHYSIHTLIKAKHQSESESIRNHSLHYYNDKRSVQINYIAVHKYSGTSENGLPYYRNLHNADKIPRSELYSIILQLL